MTYYGITVENGYHRVYATDNGIAKRLVGPRWASPRQAMAYADLQAQLDHSVTPLRASRSAAVEASGGALGDLPQTGTPGVVSPRDAGG